jgi:UDP-glucose 4-epimerase
VQPISAYGISKMAFERYLHFYFKNKGLDYSIIRIANAYGRRQNLRNQQGVIGIWLQKILSGSPLEIWGDGTVVRDYVHVKDVAQAVVSLLDYSGNRRVFNIGSGKGYSLNTILALCQKVSNRQPEVSYKLGRSFDVPKNVLNIKKAQKELGWNPLIDLEEGIRDTWDWIGTL